MLGVPGAAAITEDEQLAAAANRPLPAGQYRGERRMQAGHAGVERLLVLVALCGQKCIQLRIRHGRCSHFSQHGSGSETRENSL